MNLTVFLYLSGFFWIMRRLTDQELHNLAMNIVGRQLEAEGFEFMGVNSKLESNPQFVCLREKQLYFIVVRSVPFPLDPKLYNNGLMRKIIEHANRQHAKVYYAGVGLSNAQNQRLPVYLDEPYIVDYDGLIEMEDE